MASKIIVKKHKGRSGKSVFEWRVYNVIEPDDHGKGGKFQLGKYRTEEAALKAKALYDTNNERIAKLWAERRAAQ